MKVFTVVSTSLVPVCFEMTAASSSNGSAEKSNLRRAPNIVGFPSVQTISDQLIQKRCVHAFDAIITNQKSGTGVQAFDTSVVVHQHGVIVDAKAPINEALESYFIRSCVVASYEIRQTNFSYHIQL